MKSKMHGITFIIILCISCFFTVILTATGLNLISSGIAVILGSERQEKDRNITQNTFVEITRRFNTAVVYISSTQVVKDFQKFQPPFGDPFRDFFGDDFFDKFFNIPRGNLRQKSLGSGFIIDEQGYILTNNHLVEDAEDILVTLSDENEYKAKVVGKDDDMDVALLKIDVKGNLPVVKLGDSDELEIGEWVVAIGNPFGLEHTVTAGIVSAKWRSISQGPYNSFIQTDASINPGNSGGPLFNINGEVVGINTAIVTEGQGIGFAIPINMVKEVLHDLKHEGRIKRGWLGLMIQKVTPDLARSFGLKENKGALVSEVVEGGPADEAGIKRGDVILRFNEKEIRDFTDLSRYTGLTKPGSKINLEVIRDGKMMEVNVKLGIFEKSEQVTIKGGEATDLGMVIRDMTPELANYFNIKQSEGVLIVDIESGGLAEKAGLQKGDVIIEVNRQKINHIEDFQKMINESKENTFLFLISRENHSLYTTITR